MNLPPSKLMDEVILGNGRHIQHSLNGLETAWCGEPLFPLEETFGDLAVAAYNAANACRPRPCGACVKAAVRALEWRKPEPMPFMRTAAVAAGAATPPKEEQQ